MTVPPPRPWHRRKRTWAAALWLLLPVLYVLGSGPAAYGYERGWLSPASYITVYYNPMWELRPYIPVAAWMKWWADMGYEHESAGRAAGPRRMPQP